MEYSFSAGLLKLVLEDETVCAFEEAAEVVRGGSVEGAGIRSAMGASLRDGKRVRGVLYADNREAHVRFSADDRAFFTAISGLVAATLATSQRVQSILATAGDEDAEGDEDRLLGSSPEFHELAERARRVAASRGSVLILGERGSGKGAVARYIHRHSPRPKQPFVHINCAAIPEGLAEAELFGVGRNAGLAGVGSEGRPGLFEQAQGGTVFLDEVADLHPAVQGKLLVALRDRAIRPLGAAKPIDIDVSFIAASNRDLHGPEGGGLRADLIDRIDALRLEVPPLRKRRQDIPGLARYLLARILRRDEIDRQIVLSREACEHLSRFDWPGNVAQLENVIRTAVAFSDSDVLTIDDLPQKQLGAALPSAELLSLKEVLEQAEREHILRILERTRWVKRRAAEILGISRTTLDKRIEQYGASPPHAS